jgi:hypothetical protein
VLDSQWLFLRTATGTGTDPFDFVLRTKVFTEKAKDKPTPTQNVWRPWSLRHNSSGIYSASTGILLGNYSTVSVITTTCATFKPGLNVDCDFYCLCFVRSYGTARRPEDLRLYLPGENVAGAIIVFEIDPGGHAISEGVREGDIIYNVNGAVLFQHANETQDA